MSQPANGVAGIQQALAQRGSTQEFDTLFADWVVANYANQPQTGSVVAQVRQLHLCIAWIYTHNHKPGYAHLPMPRPRDAVLFEHL